MRYLDWTSGGTEVVPARSTSILPAVWHRDSGGDYWEQNDASDTTIPSSYSTPPNDDFTADWPGAIPATTRGWPSYWSQAIYNLHALRFVTTRDDDNYSTLRDVGMHFRVPLAQYDVHPAFGMAPPAPEWTHIQFDDEPEPLPIDDPENPQWTRGLPSILDTSAYFYASVTVGDSFPWRFSRVARPNEFQVWIEGAYHPDGLPTWRYGLPTDVGQPTEWEEVYSEDSSGHAILQTFADDEGPWLYKIEPIGGSGDREVRIDQIEMSSTVLWPAWRWAALDAGHWLKRQRQTAPGNSGGWSLRHRQSGGANGGWPLRQR